jgi:hypothetical protein
VLLDTTSCVTGLDNQDLDHLITSEQHILAQGEMYDCTRPPTCCSLPTASLHSHLEQQCKFAEDSGACSDLCRVNSIKVQREDPHTEPRLARMRRDNKFRLETDPRSRPVTLTHPTLDKLLARLERQLKTITLVPLGANCQNPNLLEQGGYELLEARARSLCRHSDAEGDTLEGGLPLVHNKITPVLCSPEADMLQAGIAKGLECRTCKRFSVGLGDSDLCLVAFDNPLFDSACHGPLCRPVVFHIAAEQGTKAGTSPGVLCNNTRVQSVKKKNAEMDANNTADRIQEGNSLQKSDLARESLTRRSLTMDSRLHDPAQQAGVSAKLKSIDDSTRAIEERSQMFAVVDSPSSYPQSTLGPVGATGAMKRQGSDANSADHLIVTHQTRRRPRAGLSTTMCLSDAKFDKTDMLRKTLMHSDLLPKFNMDFLLPLEHQDVVDILSSRLEQGSAPVHVLDLRMMPKLPRQAQWSSIGTSKSGSRIVTAPPAWTQLPGKDTHALS